jgi:hypothetical protein
MSFCNIDMAERAAALNYAGYAGSALQPERLQ